MTNHIASVLNDLVETSKDGELGFSKAGEDAHDPELKTLFLSRATECARSAHELQLAVQEHGGKPETGGSIAGALHRGWVDLKSAVSNRSDHDILVECERGEDAAKKRFGDALANNLPSDVRSLVERHYQGVLKNHDLVRDLRDRLA